MVGVGSRAGPCVVPKRCRGRALRSTLFAMTEHGGMSERQRVAFEHFMAQEDEAANESRPAAGWYPHPTMAATVRYWDGEAWTDHIAPASAHHAATPTAQPAEAGCLAPTAAATSTPRPVGARPAPESCGTAPGAR